MKNGLMPITEDDERWQRSFDIAFERERDAFQHLPPESLAAHKGQFVALSEGVIVDQDQDEISLAKRVSRMPSDKFILIKHIAG